MPRIYTKRDPMERFNSKVLKTETCHIWQGTRLGKGGTLYGIFAHRTSRPKATCLAHRWIFEQTHGLIPDGMFVLHKCDNPACVRIDHLFLGTPQQNTQDMLRKKRNFVRNGELSGMAKLSDAQVADLRRRAKNGESRKSLANRFKTCATNVRSIILGLSRSRPADRRLAKWGL
jgi:hypothetical protein